MSYSLLAISILVWYRCVIWRKKFLRNFNVSWCLKQKWLSHRHLNLFFLIKTIHTFYLIIHINIILLSINFKMVLNVWIYAYVQSTIYHIFSIDINVHVKVIAFIFIRYDCRCSLLYIYSDSVVVKVVYLSLIAQLIWPTSSNIFNHVLQIKILIVHVTSFCAWCHWVNQMIV